MLVRRIIDGGESERDLGCMESGELFLFDELSKDLGVLEVFGCRLMEMGRKLGEGWQLRILGKW